MVLVFVFFAAMMAILTAYLAKVWLDARTPVVVQQPQASKPEGLVPVLVAARPILTGTKLTRDDLKWDDWPKAAIQDRFIDQSKISEAALDAQQQPPTGPTTPIVNSNGDQGAATVGLAIIGAIARRQILMDEPIGLEAIIQPGDRSVGSAVIAPGMRAFSIPIQMESASAGFIIPGDHVDVLLAANLRSEVDVRDNRDIGLSKKDDSIVNWATETVLYNAKVLAIDQQLSHDAKDGPTINGKILTLEVTPRDAEKLFAAQQLGSFSITLRSMVSARSDSAQVVDTDNPSFHPFTSDKEASRALNSLSETVGNGGKHDVGTIVRVNRGGLISEQSF